MRKLWLLLLCCACSLANAQVPGYLGKRLAVGYHMDFTPVIDYFIYKVPDVSYKGKDQSYWLATRHNIDVEWAVSRKISLQASVGFSRNGLFSFYHEYDALKDEYPKLSESYYSYSSGESQPYDYVRARNMMYKIGFNLFSKNYVAPHGNYWNFSLLMNRSHLEYVVKGEAKDLTMIRNYGVLLSKGYRRIIKNSVIIDAGFGAGWLFGAGDGKTGIIYANQTFQNPALVFHWHFGVKYLLPM